MSYKEASQIIGHVQKKQGTVKSLVHSSGCKNIKQLYALVCQTLKYSSIIDQILTSTKFLQQEKWMEKPMAQVLLYEMLFGRGIQCGGKYRLAFKRHKSAFNSALIRMKIKMGVVNNKDLLPEWLKDEVILPRYVRVNLLKSTLQDVIDQFLADGYKCILTREQADMKTKAAGNADNIRLHADYVMGLKPHQFICDVHMEDLLVFPPATDFHDHQLYKTGAIILQDKASCLPAHVLAPPPGSHVIDACAAPGNKTSHLAAMLKNTGKVFAYDMDPNRIKTMSKLMALSGATNLEIHNQDFLMVNPRDEKFSNVKHILLDPSCSGSGIVSRLDHLTNDIQSNSKERLAALAKLQVRLLLHALSFPCVEWVVYSTCSVHRTENEGVVMETLESNPSFELEYALPMWKNRGIVVKDNAPSKAMPEARTLDISACLRAVPKEDCTNGFFVALFQRRGISAEKERTSDNLEVRSGQKRKRKKRKRKCQANLCNEISNKTKKSDNGHPDEDQIGFSRSQNPAKSNRAKKRRKGSKRERKTMIVKNEIVIAQKQHRCSFL